MMALEQLLSLRHVTSVAQLMFSYIGPTPHVYVHMCLYLVTESFIFFGESSDVSRALLLPYHNSQGK